MSARDEVLGRIRTALGRPGAQAPAVDATAVPRRYRREDPHLDRADLHDLLADRLVDYRAEVRRVADADVAATVADLLRSLAGRDGAAQGGAGAVRVGLAPGLATRWLDPARPPSGTHVVVDDPPLSVADLDALDVVVTTCAVAIAETGTLVLDAGPGCGRRALTLVPDAFVCIVPDDVIVHGVPAGLARLDPARPLTFVSGPSATSDIELQRVEGVHGPRTLAVVVVEPSSGHLD